MNCFCSFPRILNLILNATFDCRPAEFPLFQIESLSVLALMIQLLKIYRVPENSIKW